MKGNDLVQSQGYEFMVKFTPQREWIEKQGILMLLAMFFIELGAGTFLVSSFFVNKRAMELSIALSGLLGGGFHLLYLGHPTRFWRMLFSKGWKTSWVSRGLFFVVVFLSLGLLFLFTENSYFQFGAAVFAFFTMIYVGFVMAVVNSIPLWNNALLPLLYLVLGIWSGLGVTLLVLIVQQAEMTRLGPVEEIGRFFLLAFVFLTFVYLTCVRYQHVAGAVSVREIIRGRLAFVFWGGVILLGVVIPVAALFWKTIPYGVMFILIIFELIGDFSLRYCLLKAALYPPLVPGELSL